MDPTNETDSITGLRDFAITSMKLFPHLSNKGECNVPGYKILEQQQQLNL
jgi:hypothetical protein